MLTYATVTATYSNRGRMATLKKGTVTETLVYNALGQMAKTSGGALGTELFMYDESGHLIGEYSSTGILIEETIWLGDTPVATLRPNGSTGCTSTICIFYVHTDHLNTPRRVSRGSDNKLLWTWLSDPFGTTAANENPAAVGTFKYNLRFPGQIADSQAGLNQNYFRDYDAAVGRYVESDPIGLKGGVNTYAYVGANPLWFADPLGLTKCKCRALGGGSRPDPPPGYKGLMPKTCRYTCNCDCKAQPIPVSFSAGASDTATCVGQIDPHYTQPGTQVIFESFEFDTTSIIDRYINPLAPPRAFMDQVEKQCPSCKQ